HLSTAEHLLGTSCWIERLHPNTRSRADLATFCLTARTCDPASIRQAAILEIVEPVPSRNRARDRTLSPAMRTLIYPVPIMLASATPRRPAQPPARNGPGPSDD
uniref:Uncharacterized protein n=1 Tax=Aegilops tauschii subsp. strangulata TaxID=200361 RepID=A0A453JTN3_AEGTS